MRDLLPRKAPATPLDAQLTALRTVHDTIPADQQASFLARLDEVARAWTDDPPLPGYAPPRPAEGIFRPDGRLNLSGRPAAGGAGNGVPSRPYFPGGRQVRALVAPVFRDAMPPAAGREEPAVRPDPDPAPPPGPVTPPGAQPEAAASPAARCEQCGYLTTAIGHKITCEPGP